LDLTDLVCKAVYMLQLHPEIAEELALEHILVDEFQDTDPTQVALVQLLRTSETALTCVGDVDQSIYRFRGAEPRVMLNFDKYFEDSHFRYLSENHRSTHTIVDSAVQVISHNEARIRHGLRSTGVLGNPITVISTKHENQEADEICNQIEALVEDKSYDPPLKFKEIAVLYRTNWQAEALAYAMKGRQIPYRVLRGSFTSSKKTEEDDKVQLLTIHGAKGSEFRVVFVAGVEEDLLPHYNSLTAGDRRESVEEERRLFYVAMTRAKEKLILTHTRIRTTKSGYTMEHVPSRFLREIPGEMIEEQTERRKLVSLALR
jgi:superfamily I DNA/RNA helicase